MTTAEKILTDCSGDRNLQIYALSNALSVTENERDDALTRLRIEKELRARVQEERDAALERIKDLGDEIKALYGRNG